MNTVSAIETRYCGYRFRSRLEARWAVFFDQFDSEWAYEVEGFRLPSGLYLPDFLLCSPAESGGLFCEIKPLSALPTRCFEFGSGHASAPIDDQFPIEIKKMWELVSARPGFVGWITYGDPYDVITRGTLVFVNDHDVSADGILLCRFDREAKVARAARFEHGEHGAA